MGVGLHLCLHIGKHCLCRLYYRYLFSPDCWLTGEPICIKYTELLAEAGIEPSVGSVGDSYDNALAEILKWVDWFNHKSILEPIGNILPAEAEENYYAALDKVPKVA